MKVLVAQSRLTLCDTMDRSPPGSSVHAILQARILELVAVQFSRGSSWWPWDQSQVFCIAGRFFTVWATREAQSGAFFKCHCVPSWHLWSLSSPSLSSSPSPLSLKHFSVPETLPLVLHTRCWDHDKGKIRQGPDLGRKLVTKKRKTRMIEKGKTLH